MRVAFVGAGEISVRTAEILIDRGHQVVIIENDRDKIEELSDLLDCSFLNGDGSRPDILREVDPKGTRMLFCLTDSDQANLIASLVGRSLGFEQVITRIQNPEFETIGRELGLEYTIVPSRTISRYLAFMAEGHEIVELSTVIKHEARFFSFTLGEGHARTVEEMELPENSRVVCYYRSDKFLLPTDDTTFKKGDEVVLITHSKNLPELREKWYPSQAEGTDSEDKEKKGKNT